MKIMTDVERLKYDAKILATELKRTHVTNEVIINGCVFYEIVTQEMMKDETEEIQKMKLKYSSNVVTTFIS